MANLLSLRSIDLNLEVGQGFTIGRWSKCDLNPEEIRNDTFVSAIHVLFEGHNAYDSGRVWCTMTAKGSNGTYLNGSKTS